MGSTIDLNIVVQSWDWAYKVRIIHPTINTRITLSSFIDMSYNCYFQCSAYRNMIVDCQSYDGDHCHWIYSHLGDSDVVVLYL